MAIGWNVYASTTSFGEKLQNGRADGDRPGLDLARYGPRHDYAVAAEQRDGRGNVHSPISPVSVPPRTFPSQSALHPESVAEGVGFLVDHENGQLTRLSFDGNVRQGPALPIIVQYQAGYVEIPDDLREAVIRLVKMRWFSRERDPLIRSETAEGRLRGAIFLRVGAWRGGRYAGRHRRHARSQLSRPGDRVTRMRQSGVDDPLRGHKRGM